MANRTFKVYGQAYAASGDVTVALSINGTEVFNGAVNDSSTVREGQPSTENHLFSFTLDENTTGDLSYSLTATGGELCLGPTRYNGIHGTIIPDSWFTDNITSLAVSAENQTYMATQIGQTLLDAEQAGLYDKLIAGTSTTEADGAAIRAANAKGPLEFDTFVSQDDVRSSAQIDGVDLAEWDNAEVSARNWPILQDGQTFTCTWSFDAETYSS